ncbi:MAG: hypothetical protein ACI87E_003932 [Mariniblastus sp.]|jgi:uncharacterized protein YdeI (YjbR/CyaY-like superfamily)
MKKYSSVQEYMDELELHVEGMQKLRKTMLSLGIEETLKWSVPVYVAAGKNVAGIISLKKYFGVWFYQGALLSDPDKVLVNANEEKTKAMRQWRFQTAKDVKVGALKKYVLEAVRLAESGKEIKPNKSKPVIVPTELTKALAAQPAARQAFESMSKSCRREYADYISEAKRAETKIRRIEKIIPMILAAQGLNDKYKSK